MIQVFDEVVLCNHLEFLFFAHKSRNKAQEPFINTFTNFLLSKQETGGNFQVKVTRIERLNYYFMASPVYDCCPVCLSYRKKKVYIFLTSI